MSGVPPDLLQTIVAATRVRVANAQALESFGVARSTGAADDSTWQGIPWTR